jgi:hypothetical protein
MILLSTPLFSNWSIPLIVDFVTVYPTCHVKLALTTDHQAMLAYSKGQTGQRLPHLKNMIFILSTKQICATKARIDYYLFSTNY